MTGAVTLALEVMASRIMTPYFGVSLYIWAGILSITLVFLAIGYQLGGKVSAKWARSDVEYLFLVAPVASALAIVGSTLVYPMLFPWLSQGHLIVGSFVGATLLLALPLIALSAMNPLLISLLRDQNNEGDSGAGRVFFISTMGSVAGVLMTAFVFIPNMTNFRGALVLGFVLCVLVILFAWRFYRTNPRRGRVLLVLSALTGFLCVGLIIAKDGYLNAISDKAEASEVYQIVEEYTSMFGNIKVVEVGPADKSSEAVRLFVQDGLVQNRTRLDHSSLTSYTHKLEALIELHAPLAKDVLVLGLGAGIVPRNLAAKGIRTTVVEINAAALDAAVEHFGFPADRVDVQIEDARTFVRRCSARFDVGVVDLFLGDNVPDYLMAMEFFEDLKDCLNPNGALVMNVFFDTEDPKPNGRLLATIASSFPNIYLSGASSQNVYIVGTFNHTDIGPKSNDEEVIEDLASFSLPQGYLLPRRYFSGLKPISDEHNIFSILFSNANLEMRQYLAGELPAHILVN